MKLTKITHVFLAALITTVCAAESPTETELDKWAEDDAKVLGELLKEDWTVHADGAAVILTSKFEVFHIGMISRPDTPPEFSDDVPRARLLKESQPEKYVIHLLYQPKISAEELKERRNAFQTAAEILDNGAKSKEEYQKAAELYKSIEIPRYESNLPPYYIYEKLPDSPFGRFYPPKSVKKIGAAKEILAVVLRRLNS